MPGYNDLNISEVLCLSYDFRGTTNIETQESPQGNMAGHGLNLGGNGQFKKYCEEHGYIIGIVSVLPKSAYQQGIPKHFTKFDKFDYFFREFEHIGEQEIKNKEVMLTTTSANNEEVFGYTPRYSEYKFANSSVHGYFKTSLDFWHLGRIFDPNDDVIYLNQSFIECDPSRRIFAVEDENEHTLLVHMFHNVQARRPMSYFGNPSFR